MCIEENTNIYDYGYMIRNNAYQYWIGGFYGKDNFGNLTQGKTYIIRDYDLDQIQGENNGNTNNN